MAALDLSGVARAPATYLVGASIGTDWQEVIVPGWSTVLTITASHSVFYALPNGIAGRAQPADGDAAADTADKVSVSVSGGEGKFAIVMRDAEDRPATVGLVFNRSIFVAAQSGTAAVAIELGVGR